ncbi:MAG: AtpZ/AtpI family protein [Anaerolineae bacterium]|nr:AtpZ/AtpI family protein [Anaerolineae bacterium]
MNEQNNRDEQQHLSRLWRESFAAISLGWELALPIFGGVLIGHFLDRFLGTVHIFTIGLLLLGIGSGYYNLAKAIQRLKEKPRKHNYIEYIEDDEADDVFEENEEDQW